MARECHVRFCERLWVQFPRPTHLGTGLRRTPNSGHPAACTFFPRTPSQCEGTPPCVRRSRTCGPTSSYRPVSATCRPAPPLRDSLNAPLSLEHFENDTGFTLGSEPPPFLLSFQRSYHSTTPPPQHGSPKTLHASAMNAI